MSSTFRLRFGEHGYPISRLVVDRAGTRAEQERSRSEVRIPPHWQRAQSARRSAENGDGPGAHAEASC
jgi:hypothetical protein